MDVTRAVSMYVGDRSSTRNDGGKDAVSEESSTAAGTDLASLGLVGLLPVGDSQKDDDPCQLARTRLVTMY